MPRDYYISPLGDDRAQGTEASPWRTLDKLQELNLLPGDRIRLDSRLPHQGHLILRGQHGRPAQPIIITNYGSENPATILSSEGIGLLLWNSSSIHVSNLHIKGAGYPLNQTHGVCLFADEAQSQNLLTEVASRKNRYSDIVLENLEIEKFGCAGVSVGAQADFGFRDVTIRGTKVHDNAYAGILIWGPGNDHAHDNINVIACEAFDNHGVPGLLHITGHGHHSGHGILMSCVSVGMIESSRAYRNGGRCTAHICGPAGIWASNSRHITIRKNESFENRTAGATDGGGFGFDGGMQDSIMEDNLSYENDGAGFLMAQYYGAKPFSGNSFVRNVSRNDGRHNDNGAIHVWGSQDSVLRDLLIEGNHVEISASNRGRPMAFYVDAATENLRVIGNTFNGSGQASVSIPGLVSGLASGSIVGDQSLPLLIQVSPLHDQLSVSANRVVGSGAILWRDQVYEEVGRWLEAVPQ